MDQSNGSMVRNAPLIRCRYSLLYALLIEVNFRGARDVLTSKVKRKHETVIKNNRINDFQSRVNSWICSARDVIFGLKEMKQESGFIEDSDSSDVSDDDSISTSDTEGSDSEQEEPAPGSSAADESSTIPKAEGSDEEEEDEVVKAIMRSKELHRDHPPAIVVEDYIVDVCFHPARDSIALASITGDVLLYNYSNEETTLVSTMELHTKACRDIEFSQDGKVLFSTSKDKSIILTDVATEKMKRVYDDAHENPIYTMTVLSENTFTTGDDEGVVKLWDLRQAGSTPVFSMKEMEDYVSTMITNSDGKYLVCASGDGSLTTINIPARKLHVQSEEYEEELTCLGLFKAETKLLAATSKGKMYVFNWGEFGLHSDESPSLTKKAINCMVPITEHIVVTGGEDGILRATSIFPHRHLGVVGQHNFSIESLDISNDGTLIASSSHNNDVKFWNVKYFETLNTHDRVKGGKQKQLRHNLPSSKVNNASDFFSDL